MKILRLFLLGMLCPFAAMSQNTFPATGNVGIGTSSPTEKLHVEGNLYIGGPMINGAFQSHIYYPGHSLMLGAKPGAYAHSYVDLKPGGSNTGPLIGVFRIFNAPMQDSNILKVQLASDGSSFINGGRVGIGTNNPSFLLHVNGPDAMGIAVQNTAPLSISSGGFFRAYVTGTPSAPNQRLGVLLFGSSTNYAAGASVEAFAARAWVIGSSYASYLRFTTTAPGENVVSERMRITEDGNVAIGTVDPKGYKLAVNGNAIFTRVKVKAFAAWPDYVFENDYTLPSLPEVASFIKEHKHLPGIPAADVVKADGIDVGEMNVKLLQKVEELTLYLLEEHRKNKEQEKAIAELQAEIAKLKQ